MPKELMNEAERFLLQHWDEARLLEESMEGVRVKYKELFQQIIEAVTEAHPELDARIAYPTQFWGSGSIGFGRTSWPGRDNWPSGFWMWNLRLENLAMEESDAPSATVWLSSRGKKSTIDAAAARIALMEAAQTLLTSQELESVAKDDPSDVLFRFTAPSKRELLDLLADGDGQKFVARFVSQFELMTRFVPVLNKVFQQLAI